MAISMSGNEEVPVWAVERLRGLGWERHGGHHGHFMAPERVLKESIDGYSVEGYLYYTWLEALEIERQVVVADSPVRL